jgi:alpha-beta hydrolase superfamily lysophospholipase
VRELLGCGHRRLIIAVAPRPHRAPDAIIRIVAQPADADPDESGEHAGLAYARFRPQGKPIGGMLVLHGAASRKENHFDFVSRAREEGFEAIGFDARGHGDSAGEMDGRAIDDVVAIASLLPRPLALRGSSMGGYFAIVTAARCEAAAVVAICPASARGLAAGLHRPERTFAADVAALEELLGEHDEIAAVRDLTAPLLIQHAEEDEIVPIAHSREVLAAAGSADKRLTAIPGGHHRSVQHDPALQAQAIAFAREAIVAASRAASTGRA